MIVTITTDASFNQDFKIGAYAFWVSCNEGRYRKSGVLKSVNDHNEGEFKSILNALHFVANLPLSKITRVIVNTDSVMVIRCVENKKKEKTDWVAQLKEQYLSIISAAGFKAIEFRHVKAHKSKEEKRQWVNAWCDKESRNAMRAQIMRLYGHDGRKINKK